MSGIQNYSSCSNEAGLAVLFKQLAGEYRDFGHEAGITILAYRDPGVPLFRALPIAVQQQVVNRLQIAVDICRETKAQGKRLENSPAITWQALKRLNLRPPSDLFSHIQDTTVVEIYTPEGLQIFRSFGFLKHCSYSLEELLCSSWNELFARDDDTILGQIFKFVSDVFSGVITRTVSLSHIPTHINREVRSPERHILEIEMHWGAPLFSEGTAQAEALIVLGAGRAIGKARAAKVEPAAVRPSLQIVPPPSL